MSSGWNWLDETKFLNARTIFLVSQIKTSTLRGSNQSCHNRVPIFMNIILRFRQFLFAVIIFAIAAGFALSTARAQTSAAGSPTGSAALGGPKPDDDVDRDDDVDKDVSPNKTPHPPKPPKPSPKPSPKPTPKKP